MTCGVPTAIFLLQKPIHHGDGATLEPPRLCAHGEAVPTVPAPKDMSFRPSGDSPKSTHSEARDVPGDAHRCALAPLTLTTISSACMQPSLSTAPITTARIDLRNAASRRSTCTADAFSGLLTFSRISYDCQRSPPLSFGAAVRTPWWVNATRLATRATAANRILIVRQRTSRIVVRVSYS